MEAVQQRYHYRAMARALCECKDTYQGHPISKPGHRGRHGRFLVVISERLYLMRRIGLVTISVLALIAVGECSFAQAPLLARVDSPVVPLAERDLPSPSFSSSSSTDLGDLASSPGALYVTPSVPYQRKTSHAFRDVGMYQRVGTGGIGLDIATAVSQKLNIRVGADFFSYATSFQDQGANVDLRLRLLSGHAALDWFPFAGRFRVSPLVVFGNNTRIRGTVLVPAGSTITLAGEDYTSSHQDPLHGSASIDVARVSPGLSVGFGNMVPRARGRLSFPFEAGFYYAGQPRLKVAFSGSACDPTQPEAIGCQPVSQDPGFQRDLVAFRARNANNLSYISFVPIVSVGCSWRFSKSAATF